jgi:hypothetical protein
MLYISCDAQLFDNLLDLPVDVAPACSEFSIHVHSALMKKKHKLAVLCRPKPLNLTLGKSRAQLDMHALISGSEVSALSACSELSILCPAVVYYRFHCEIKVSH